MIWRRLRGSRCNVSNEVASVWCTAVHADVECLKMSCVSEVNAIDVKTVSVVVGNCVCIAVQVIVAWHCRQLWAITSTLLVCCRV